MSKKRNRKKGSVLVTVVCLCAVLSIMTISLITATTGGFALRKEQNKRIENFYSADSGVEIAENKTVSIIKEAINSGNTLIETIKNNAINYPEIDITVDGWEQKPFKQEFERYIDENLEKAIDNVSIGNSEDGSVAGDTTTLSVIYNEFKRDGKEIKVDAFKGQRYEEGKPVMGSSDYKKERIQKWKLKSNFKDKDEQEREIAVNYNVKTPDYGKTSGRVVENTGIFDYIMGIDGNLDIYNGGSFNSLGDMWVGGKNQKGDRNVDLLTYDPGIKLQAGTNGSGAFDWNGNITTPKDLMIENAALRANNLYADDLVVKMENVQKPTWGAGETDEHIIIGGIRTGQEIEGSINVYNDLVFDAKSATLKTKNYYGLNDIDRNLNPTSEDLLTDKMNWGKSSSIIVASEDFGTNSKIKIQKDMYVMGTAYLQLDGVDYKTGESIAINKYSEPYTQRKISELSDGDYLYKYMNPLQVVDKKLVGDEYKNLSVVDKVQIVKDYINSNESHIDKAGFSGVELGGKAYTAGVMYDTGKISESHIDDVQKCGISEHKHTKEMTIVECKQKEFVEEAYNMGGTLGNSEAKMYFKEKKALISVDKSFNWDFIRENMMNKNHINDSAGNKIFERDEKLVYPATGEDKTVAVYRSTKTVGEIMPDLKSDFFDSRKINIIFNVSNQKDSIDDSKDLFFEKGASGLKETSKGEIELPMELIDNGQTVNIVISDGAINVLGGTGNLEIRAMLYTTENLNLGTNASMTFGNYSVPNYTQLNEIFKELFGGVIDGVVDGGIIEEENGESVINPSELLEQENWNLIK